MLHIRFIFCIISIHSFTIICLYVWVSVRLSVCLSVCSCVKSWISTIFVRPFIHPSGAMFFAPLWLLRLMFSARPSVPVQFSSHCIYCKRKYFYFNMVNEKRKSGLHKRAAFQRPLDDSLLTVLDGAQFLSMISFFFFHLDTLRKPIGYLPLLNSK